MAITVDSGWMRIIPEKMYKELFSKYSKLEKDKGSIYVKNNKTGEEYSIEMSHEEFHQHELKMMQWYHDMFPIIKKEFSEAGLIFHPKPNNRTSEASYFKEKWGEFVICLRNATQEKRKKSDGLAKKLEEKHDIKIDIT